MFPSSDYARMKRVAQDYNSTGYTAPAADLAANGMIKLTVPILNTAHTTTQAEWDTLETTLAETSSGSKVTYRPAKVYDNLNSAAGYTKSSSYGGRQSFPVNNYIVNLSTRSSNPVTAPLKLSSLGFMKYEITGPVRVEYIALNATSNSGRVSVSFWDEGVPMIFNSTNVSDSNSTMLSLGGPSSTVFSSGVYRLTNQEIVTMNGESIAHMQDGWNRLYDGPCIKAIYMPNSDVRATTADIVGQLVISFSVRTLNYTTSNASYGVMEWAANGYSVEGGEAATRSLPVGFQQAGEQGGTHTSCRGSIVKTTDALSKGALLADKKAYKAVKLTSNNKGAVVFARNNIRKLTEPIFGPKFAENADPLPDVIGGAREIKGKLGYLRSSNFLMDLGSSFDFNWPECKINIVNGMYLQVYDWQGREYMMGEDYSYLATRYIAPPSSSNLYETGRLIRQGELYQPFEHCSLIKQIEDKDHKVVATSENVKTFFIPYVEKGQEYKGIEHKIVLNQTLTMAVPFKDTHEEKPDRQKAHVNFIDREMEENPIEREDSHIGQTADLNGLALAAVNSKQITVPNELNDMPELRAKYVEGKRMSMLHSDPQNGILTSIARMGLCAVSSAIDYFEQNSANAGTYAVTKAKNMLGAKGPAGGVTSELIGSLGEDSNAYFVVPDCARSEVTEEPPKPEIIACFPEFECAHKYSMKPPRDQDKAYFIKVNNTYEICPAITIGLSNPVLLGIRNGDPGSTLGEAAVCTILYPPTVYYRALLTPKIDTDVWPCLMASRFPPGDKNSVRRAVFLTNPLDQYQKVNFTEELHKGLNQKTWLKSANLYTEHSLPVNLASLQFSNNITINTGFYIPDQLPDKNGVLKPLEKGEKMYVYCVFRMQHNTYISEELIHDVRLFSPLPDKHPAYVNRTGCDIETWPIWSQDPIGFMYVVATDFDRILYSDSTSGESVSDPPNKGVNCLINTHTSVQISKTGKI